jgi:hypothetical protein
MSDPKIDVVGHRFVGADAAPSGDAMRSRLEDAADDLRAGGDDVAGARSLLAKAERTLARLEGEDAAALRDAMQGLRDALPASARDETLRLDQDVAVVPGSMEAHFHTEELAGIGADVAHVGVFVAESAHVAGAVAASYAAVPLAIGINGYLAIEALVTAESDGARDGLLGAAFGGMGGGSPGWAAGIGAALRGLHPADRQALRASLPDAMDRQRFDEAYDVAMQGRRDQPEAFAEARTEYGRVYRSYTDGLAAGTQGWDTPGRGPAFESGRAAARRRLAEPGGNAVRAVSREIKLEGFRDAMDDEVDAYRYDNDPHYRSGVSHFRRVGAEGPEAMARELSRLDLSDALQSRHARIEG